MARRTTSVAENLFDLFLDLPWWASLIGIGVILLLFNLLTPAIIPKHSVLSETTVVCSRMMGYLFAGVVALAGVIKLIMTCFSVLGTQLKKHDRFR